MRLPSRDLKCCNYSSRLYFHTIYFARNAVASLRTIPIGPNIDVYLTENIVFQRKIIDDEELSMPIQISVLADGMAWRHSVEFAADVEDGPRVPPSR